MLLVCSIMFFTASFAFFVISSFSLVSSISEMLLAALDRFPFTIVTSLKYFHFIISYCSMMMSPLKKLR